MDTLTPITPLEPGVEMFQRGRLESLLSVRDIKPRPISEATEIFDTDFEDDGSDFEEYSNKDSFETNSRRSQTTISTFDEVPTPHSSQSLEKGFDFRIQEQEQKPVEGPRGPHLFRASLENASVELDMSYDYALQLSPLHKLEPMELPRIDTAFRPATVVPFQPFQEPPPAQEYENEIRSWSAQQVATWMYASGFEEAMIDNFEQHDITGAVLMDLQFEDLKELGIHSFGKRHQLWNEIVSLRGGDGRISPSHTPFQDTSRPCTVKPRSKSRARSKSRRRGDETPVDEAKTPITPGGTKKRRGRKKAYNGTDIVTPMESVSIVAIEQLLPKPHKCAKGERCAKWRKQQRQLAQLRDEHGFPISPEKGGRIIITGTPAATSIPPPTAQRPGEDQAPTMPSLVASSDLLGPGMTPTFALHEDRLGALELRDPQENVKHFLSLQHVQHHPERPASPPMEMFPSLQPPQQTPGPHQNLRSLPRLAIPTGAQQQPQQQLMLTSAVDAFSPCRTAISPGGLYRYGTPFSDMDVPITAIPIDPLSRDASQSVPPNMQYRDPISRSNSRATHYRRPSVGMAPLPEGVVYSAVSPQKSLHHDPITRPTTSQTMRMSSSTRSHTPSALPLSAVVPNTAISAPTPDTPGPKPSPGEPFGANHAGWMKKRKTRLLRHEWQDHHFRLHGTRLAMHASDRLSSATLDAIDVDDYAVACSSIQSGNKLSAKLKSLAIGGGPAKKDEHAPAAFSFQLVPQGKEGERKRAAEGKTHHFAVKGRDERIDWMRELMLAKAMKQKGEGYEVKVNGNAV